MTGTEFLIQVVGNVNFWLYLPNFGAWSANTPLGSRIVRCSSEVEGEPRSLLPVGLDNAACARPMWRRFLQEIHSLHYTYNREFCHLCYIRQVCVAQLLNMSQRDSSAPGRDPFVIALLRRIAVICLIDFKIRLPHIFVSTSGNFNNKYYCNSGRLVSRPLVRRCL